MILTSLKIATFYGDSTTFYAIKTSKLPHCHHSKVWCVQCHSIHLSLNPCDAKLSWLVLKKTILSSISLTRGWRSPPLHRPHLATIATARPHLAHPGSDPAGRWRALSARGDNGLQSRCCLRRGTSVSWTTCDARTELGTRTERLGNGQRKLTGCLSRQKV